jgi:hypothetical protein
LPTVTVMFSSERILPLARRYRELRRKKDEVLDLPPKIRSWVPVDISNAPAALSAVEGFLDWYQGTDPSAPNDTQFLARLTKVRVALHKAKHKAVAERIEDVIATGDKVVVFTAFSDGVLSHAKTLGERAVTITGSQTAEERLAAVDRFQSDPIDRGWCFLPEFALADFSRAASFSFSPLSGNLPQAMAMAIAKMRAATKITRAYTAFSHNPTGTLLRRHLTQFVAAIDATSH